MSPLERIRALHRLADRTTFPGEAESARAKAKELQAKYGIPDEALAAPQPPPQQPRPAPPAWSGGFYGFATAANTPWMGVSYWTITIRVG